MINLHLYKQVYTLQMFTDKAYVAKLIWLSDFLQCVKYVICTYIHLLSLEV